MKNTVILIGFLAFWHVSKAHFDSSPEDSSGPSSEDCSGPGSDDFSGPGPQDWSCSDSGCSSSSDESSNSSPEKPSGPPKPVKPYIPPPPIFTTKKPYTPPRIVPYIPPSPIFTTKRPYTPPRIVPTPPAPIVPVIPTTPPPVVPNTPETVEDCKKRCAVTTEYNPVCGTDNVSYDNMGRFECARSCGANISILKKGLCTANTKTYQESDVLRCVKDCKVKNEYRPVCGTNGVTYANGERLHCANLCGVDVKLHKQTSCRAIVNLNHEITKTEVDFCLNVCPYEHILDPVCGTNGVSYINKGHLKCAKECGHTDAVHSRDGMCGTTEKKNHEPTTASPHIVPPNSASSEVADTNLSICMTSCQYSMSKDDPICGNDGVTYNNPRHLLCYQYCGVDIKISKFGECSSSGTSNPGPTTTPVPGPSNNIPTDPNETSNTTEDDPVINVNERFGIRPSF